MKQAQFLQRLFVFFGLVMMSACGQANDNTSDKAAGINRVIEVNGSAKQSVAPDIARLPFTINVRGKDLAELKADVDNKTASLVALCKKLGIERKDISSAEVNIHPQYNHQTRTLIGYSVSRTVNVVLREINKYTELMNGAIAAGVNTVGRISLDIEDRDALQSKALAAAVDDARNKAEILANSAGVSVGRVISLRETGGGRGVEPYLYRDSAVNGVAKGAFEPGEITLTTSVAVKYFIK